jgi:general secretion pathway protein G
MLVFVLALSVLLALSTQLRHVGFAVSCFLVATAIGRWRRKWRLFAASLTALIVFTSTYLACWVAMGSASVMNRLEFVYAEMELEQVNEALQKYAEANGKFPASLQALTNVQSLAPRFVGPSGELLDPWGHPFHYRLAGDGFELVCLGRDGKVGGVGLDADMLAGGERDDSKMRLPLSQFLFETPGSGPVFAIAVMSGLFAGGIWFSSARTKPTSTTRLAAGIAVTTIAAVIVAVFLALFHVAAVQSGH